MLRQHYTTRIPSRYEPIVKVSHGYRHAKHIAWNRPVVLVPVKGLTWSQAKGLIAERQVIRQKNPGPDRRLWFLLPGASGGYQIAWTEIYRAR